MFCVFYVMGFSVSEMSDSACVSELSLMLGNKLSGSKFIIMVNYLYEFLDLTLGVSCPCVGYN